ncbi:unnamed protein product [Strongylus vulgaris]|uniref:CHK kinase-like domain-containing protein n=1 Tax=Strongylus vulgaris TaxID=40348 RepID=A0A3P7KDM3_STRVU|nr:unnamed protein product [Strongylus vulgaris]
MNLYTPSNGLLGTHVTWEDIEEDMQRELDTVASFGPNKTAKNVGDGRGFMSRIALIEPDWQHKDKQLPEKFVVKIFVPKIRFVDCVSTSYDGNYGRNVKKEKHEEHFRQGGAQNGNGISAEACDLLFQSNFHCYQVHNAEINVYNHLLKLPQESFPNAKIYYMKKFSEYNPVKGYLIMEYIENIKPVHVYENIPPKSLSKVLRAKAVLEALSLRFTVGEKKEFTNKPFTELFAPIFTEETVQSMVLALRDFGTESIKQKIDEMQKVLVDVIDLPWADQLADELGD